jgi:transcriptional regulator with XRE-family HTH domain
VTLGNAIKVVRTATGLKQRDVAAKIGVTANYMSLVEGGKREPSLAFLNRLAKTLGIPVGIFFLWQEMGEAGPDSNRIRKIRDLLTRLEAMYITAKISKSPRRRRAA